jgi:hypothetical protein
MRMASWGWLSLALAGAVALGCGDDGGAGGGASDAADSASGDAAGPDVGEPEDGDAGGGGGDAADAADGAGDAAEGGGEIDAADASEPADADAEDAGDASDAGDTGADGEQPLACDPEALALDGPTWNPACALAPSEALTLWTPEGAAIGVRAASSGTHIGVVVNVEADGGGAQHLEAAVVDVTTGALVAPPVALLPDDTRRNDHFDVAWNGKAFAVVWTEAEGALLDPERDITTYVSTITKAGAVVTDAKVVYPADTEMQPPLLVASDGGLRFSALLRAGEGDEVTVIAQMMKTTLQGDPVGVHFISNAEAIAYLDALPDGESLLIPFAVLSAEALSVKYFYTQVDNPVCTLPTATDIAMEPGSAVLGGVFGDAGYVAWTASPAPEGCPEGTVEHGRLFVLDLLGGGGFDLPAPVHGPHLVWGVYDGAAHVVLALTGGAKSAKLLAWAVDVSQGAVGPAVPLFDVPGGGVGPGDAWLDASGVNLLWVDGAGAIRWRVSCASGG